MCECTGLHLLQLVTRNFSPLRLSHLHSHAFENCRAACSAVTQLVVSSEAPCVAPGQVWQLRFLFHSWNTNFAEGLGLEHQCLCICRT